MSREKTKTDEFEIIDFVKRHLKVSSWMNERSIVYSLKELNELVHQAKNIFKREPVLVALTPPCLIIGDIHGQYRDLMRVLNCANVREEHAEKKYAFSCHRFMFLGDYVDRGPHSLEVISLMFALKIIYPTQYMLLRGNHETKAINYAYGFREELVNKFGLTKGIELWESFNDAFAHMPLAGIVGGKILCMHGGISPYLNSLDDILKIPKPLVDVNTNLLAQDLLWADPLSYSSIYSISKHAVYVKNAVRGVSLNFNETAVHKVCKSLNIELIVRAHQVMENGFSFFADRKLITIFSAPRYMNETNNMGAVLRVEEDGTISIATLKAKPIVPTNTPHQPTQAKSLADVEKLLKAAKLSKTLPSPSPSKK